MFLVLAHEGRLQRLADFLWCKSRLGPHPDTEPGPARAVERCNVHGGRQEHIGRRARLRAGEAFRRHAYDFVSLAPDAERLSDHRRIAAEPALPILVAQDGHGTRSGLEIVGRKEQSSQGGPKSENAKHIAGQILAVEPSRLVAVADYHAGTRNHAHHHQLRPVLHKLPVFDECWVIEIVAIVRAAGAKID